MAAGGCACKGHFFKMCAKCADIKPYMEFRFGANGGYFWGQGFPIEAERGMRPYWSLPPKREDENE